MKQITYLLVFGLLIAASLSVPLDQADDQSTVPIKSKEVVDTSLTQESNPEDPKQDVTENNDKTSLTDINTKKIQVEDQLSVKKARTCLLFGPLRSHEIDCTKYYFCRKVGKKPVLQSCSSGYYFDDKARKCVEGSCSDANDNVGAGAGAAATSGVPPNKPISEASKPDREPVDIVSKPGASNPGQEPLNGDM